MISTILTEGTSTGGMTLNPKFRETSSIGTRNNGSLVVVPVNPRLTFGGGGTLARVPISPRMTACFGTSTSPVGVPISPRVTACVGTSTSPGGVPVNPRLTFADGGTPGGVPISPRITACFGTSTSPRGVPVSPRMTCGTSTSPRGVPLSPRMTCGTSTSPRGVPVSPRLTCGTSTSPRGVPLSPRMTCGTSTSPRGVPLSPRLTFDTSTSPGGTPVSPRITACFGTGGPQVGIPLSPTYRESASSTAKARPFSGSVNNLRPPSSVTDPTSQQYISLQEFQALEQSHTKRGSKPSPHYASKHNSKATLQRPSQNESRTMAQFKLNRSSEDTSKYSTQHDSKATLQRPAQDKSVTTVQRPRRRISKSRERKTSKTSPLKSRVTKMNSISEVSNKISNKTNNIPSQNFSKEIIQKKKSPNHTYNKSQPKICIPLVQVPFPCCDNDLGTSAPSIENDSCTPPRLSYVGFKEELEEKNLDSAIPRSPIGSCGSTRIPLSDTNCDSTLFTRSSYYDQSPSDYRNTAFDVDDVHKKREVLDQSQNEFIYTFFSELSESEGAEISVEHSDQELKKNNIRPATVPSHKKLSFNITPFPIDRISQNKRSSKKKNSQSSILRSDSIKSKKQRISDNLIAQTIGTELQKIYQKEQLVEKILKVLIDLIKKRKKKI